MPNYTLYYRNGTVARAVLILLEEFGLDYKLEYVDFKTRTLDDGRDYTKINPTGAVPALQLKNGQVLTQVSAILQYLGAISRVSVFKPKRMERTRLQESLAFCQDIQSAYVGAMNAPNAEAKKAAIDRYFVRLSQLETQLTATNPFVLGSHYTQADIFAVVCIEWAEKFGVDWSKYPKCHTLLRRVHRRPAVIEVFAIEKRRQPVKPRL